MYSVVVIQAPSLPLSLDIIEQVTFVFGHGSCCTDPLHHRRSSALIPVMVSVLVGTFDADSGEVVQDSSIGDILLRSLERKRYAYREIPKGFRNAAPKSFDFLLGLNSCWAQC